MCLNEHYKKKLSDFTGQYYKGQLCSKKTSLFVLSRKEDDMQEAQYLEYFNKIYMTRFLEKRVFRVWSSSGED